MKARTMPALAAVATMLAAPLAAAAQDAAASSATDVYKPAGPWAVDYGDDYCRLARNFSDGTNTLSLAFERIQPGPALRLILVGADLKIFRSAEEVGWHYTPAGGQRAALPTQSQTEEGKPWYNFGEASLDPNASSEFTSMIRRRHYTSMSPLAPLAAPTTSAPPPPALYSREVERQAGKAITGLVVDKGLAKPIEVDTGELGSAIAALQACADDLAKGWGVDPAKIATPAKPQVVQTLAAGTIPFADFGKLSNGFNRVRLTIDADGKPTGCFIHWPTLDKGTNEKICKSQMDKTRFIPAKDAEGKPVPGYWMTDPISLMTPLVVGR